MDTNKKNYEYLKARLPITKIDQNGQNSTGGTCNKTIDGNALFGLTWISSTFTFSFNLFIK